MPRARHLIAASLVLVVAGSVAWMNMFPPQRSDVQFMPASPRIAPHPGVIGTAMPYAGSAPSPPVDTLHGPASNRGAGAYGGRISNEESRKLQRLVA